MNLGRPIYWHEGVFLRPQHFQQQDEAHNAKLLAVAAALRPHFWGVCSLEVSEESLKRQVFEIVSGEFLFQDGTLASFPGNARFHPRSFEAHWEPSGKPLAVYLGVRKLAPAGLNVPEHTGEPSAGAGPASVREGAGFRYLPSDPQSLTKDLYSREGGQPVQYLEYNLQLFFEAEVEEATEYCLIQIAEVERFGSEIRMVHSFVPPSLLVDSSPHLLRILREVREQMTSRGSELAQYKHGKGIEATDLGSRDLLYLMGLLCLNRWTPLLHHLNQASTLSPWEAYGLLRQVVGELSTFSTRYDVFGAPAETPDSEGLPPYEHTDLRRCFSEASRAITRLLEELTAGPDYVASLLYDGTYYYADVPQRVFQGSNRFYLCIRSEGDPDQIISTLQSIAKLSSKEYLPILIARALPGVGLEYLAVPPNELPRRPGSTYFSLEPQGPAWEAVRGNLNLAIYLETIPAEIEPELMVIYGK